jgi:hypothetical protein
MQEINKYQLEVQGQINESDFNATSPHRVKVEKTDDTATLLTLRTDQSGLVGLIRHLHHQDFVLLSVSLYQHGNGNEGMERKDQIVI